MWVDKKVDTILGILVLCFFSAVVLIVSFVIINDNLSKYERESYSVQIRKV